MKKLIFAFLIAAYTNCGAQTIYQVAEWESNSVKLDEKKNMIYSNDHIVITYNFWTDVSEVEFSIYNKSEQAITIEWSKSHFILHNYSNDYFNGNESTFSTSNLFRTSGYYTSNAVSTSVSTVKKDRLMTHLPPNSYTTETFKIKVPLFFSCENYFKKLKNGQVEEFDYTELSSPYHLRNYITYVSNDNKVHNVDNDFFVVKLRNMNKQTFEGVKVKTEYCNQVGKKSTKMNFSYPFYRSNRNYQTFRLPDDSCCF